MGKESNTSSSDTKEPNTDNNATKSNAISIETNTTGRFWNRNPFKNNEQNEEKKNKSIDSNEETQPSTALRNFSRKLFTTTTTTPASNTTKSNNTKKIYNYSEPEVCISFPEEEELEKEEKTKSIKKDELFPVVPSNTKDDSNNKTTTSLFPVLPSSSSNINIKKNN